MYNSTESDVVSKVRFIISEILKVNTVAISSNSRIREDLGADSLDKLTIVMALEDEFGSSISDEEASKLKTVAAIEQFIQKRINCGNSH
ncbi:MAG: acyl carrier protein [Fibrobacter sp.]|nr:acyl carrier protein [Fibrobacter sp.]